MWRRFLGKQEVTGVGHEQFDSSLKAQHVEMSRMAVGAEGAVPKQPQEETLQVDGSFSLFVRSRARSRVISDLHPFFSIATLLHRVEASTGTAGEEHSLQHSGIVLDLMRTLEDYCIGKDSEVQLVPRARGGVRPATLRSMLPPRTDESLPTTQAQHIAGGGASAVRSLGSRPASARRGGPVPGSQVRLENVMPIELNGRIATVVCWSEKHQLWKVRIEGRDRPLGLHERSLLPVSPAHGAAAGSSSGTPPPNVQPLASAPGSVAFHEVPSRVEEQAVQAMPARSPVASQAGTGAGSSTFDASSSKSVQPLAPDRGSVEFEDRCKTMGCGASHESAKPDPSSVQKASVKADATPRAPTPAGAALAKPQQDSSKAPAKEEENAQPPKDASDHGIEQIAAQEDSDPVAALDFEHSTPMLAMPFATFMRQGRIFKSVKAWRDEALSKGWLVEYERKSGKVVIFVSHTCTPRCLPTQLQ